jgi:hypothetical protein
VCRPVLPATRERPSLLMCGGARGACFPVCQQRGRTRGGEARRGHARGDGARRQHDFALVCHSTRLPSRRDGGALGGGHGRRGRVQELADAAASRPRARPAAARGAGAHRRHGLPTAGRGGAPTAAADARGGARPRPSRARGSSSGERSCPSAGEEELPTARPVPLLHYFSSIQNCSLSLPQPGRCMFACCKLII